MSAKVETKTFGKGSRTVPHHSEKAQKWYPAEGDAQSRKVRFAIARLLMHDCPTTRGLGTYEWGWSGGIGGDDPAQYQGQVAQERRRCLEPLQDCTIRDMMHDETATRKLA